ncbi:MAG: TonB-dependent receptor [Colwellia sp.]
MKKYSPKTTGREPDSVFQLPLVQNILAKHIKAILFSSVSLAILASPSVFAAQAIEEKQTPVVKNIAAEDDEDEIEVIEVTGMRYSQASAIARKKDGGTMMDSIVAEDIGVFPDKNIGEALQRIPGIQLDRKFGEGAGISIRGVDSSLLRIEVNNISQLGIGDTRAVDFTGLASELVSSLDVIKGTEARLTEGGIGGTVQVNTRKPAEFEDHFFSVNMEGQYNDLTGNVSPKLNLIGVAKITDDFGILLNTTFSDKHTMIHALRNTEWKSIADYDHVAEKTTVNSDYADITDSAYCAGANIEDQIACESQWYDYSPHLPRVGIWERNDERISANLMMQYKFTDNFSSHIGYTYSGRDKVAEDFNLHAEGTGVDNLNSDTVIVDEYHNVTHYDTVLGGATIQGYKFDWTQNTSMIDAGFEYELDQLKIVGIASRSTAEEDIDSLRTAIWSKSVSGISVDLDGSGAPEWDFSQGHIVDITNPDDTSNQLNVNDPANFNGGISLAYLPSLVEATQDMAQIDVTYTFDNSFFKMVRTGARWTSNERETWSWREDISRSVASEYGDDLDNQIEFTQEDLTELIYGNTTMTPVLFDGYDLGTKTIGQFLALDAITLGTDIRDYVGQNATRSDLDVQSGNFLITEKTLGGYVQLDFETELAGMEFWGNFGVRVTTTETETYGDINIKVMVDQTEDGVILVDELTGYDKGGVEHLAANFNDIPHPDTFSGRKSVFEKYTDVLPSINLSLGLIPDELVLFFGAGKVMSRPKMSDLNTNASCTHWDTRASKEDGYSEFGKDYFRDKCSAGNPDLSPYRANQMDLALSWYPDEYSIISGAVFTKELTSWIIGSTTRYDIDFFNDGRLWDVTQKTNGAGATTTGVELQASTIFDTWPAPFNNLGGSINYTYMTADDVGLYNQLTGEELPFPSQSENSYNIVGFYEDENISFRVAYNYRDEYLASEAERSGNPVYIDDVGYLDAKFTYTVNEHFKIFIDGRNLLSEVRLANSGVGRLSDLQWSGREYAIGFSYTM